MYPDLMGFLRIVRINCTGAYWCGEREPEYALDWMPAFAGMTGIVIEVAAVAMNVS
jgi:hypothetical protein